MKKEKPEETLEKTEDVITEELPEGQEANPLPEGVTEAPRNAEEMHLSLIKDSSPLVEAYLAVSDDQGELLGDKDLEEEVKRYCALYQRSKKEGIEDYRKFYH